MSKIYKDWIAKETVTDDLVLIADDLENAKKCQEVMFSNIISNLYECIAGQRLPPTFTTHLPNSENQDVKDDIKTLEKS